jgi:dUTP pyrophosphatase
MASFQGINGFRYAALRIFVNSDNSELRRTYENHVQKHNEEVMKSAFPNSGFDLFTPSHCIFDETIESKFIDLEIHCEMTYENQSTGFYMFPRSSISKTPLMLANHTGVIDSGYRGRMIGAFRWLGSQENDESNYIIEKNTRFLQICHPSLCPIIVTIVDNLNDFSTSERGSGGFGSTGR